jgi:hypothetical protein
MAEEFLSNLLFDSNYPIQSSDRSNSERERLRLILLGSNEGVHEMIYRLHQQRVAEVGLWSRLLPVPNSDEVMSLLVLYRRRG